MAPASAAAIILAGGKSSRFGRDKASEVVLGKPLLQHVIDRLAGLGDEVAVVRAPGQKLPDAHGNGMRVVEDVYESVGPLGGIYAGLLAIDAPLAIAVACDMPLLQPRLLSQLTRLGREHELVVPLRGGLPEPLCAVYSKACLGPIQAQIEAREYKVTGFYERMLPRYVPPEEWLRFDPDGLSFENVNVAGDLARVEAFLLAEARKV